MQAEAHNRILGSKLAAGRHLGEERILGQWAGLLAADSHVRPYCPSEGLSKARTALVLSTRE